MPYLTKTSQHFHKHIKSTVSDYIVCPNQTSTAHHTSRNALFNFHWRICGIAKISNFFVVLRRTIIGFAIFTKTAFIHPIRLRAIVLDRGKVQFNCIDHFDMILRQRSAGECSFIYSKKTSNVHIAYLVFLNSEISGPDDGPVCQIFIRTQPSPYAGLVPRSFLANCPFGIWCNIQLTG